MILRSPRVQAAGDILFLEACRERGVRLQLLLPLPEPEFIQRSILPSIGGEKWRERYYNVKPGIQAPPRVMPDELGPAPKVSILSSAAISGCSTQP